MTIISVHAPLDRITVDQRSSLSQSLTDAVLKVEIGDQVDSARIGFQVYFSFYDPSCIAISGKLISEVNRDCIFIDIAVMDGYWPHTDRGRVIDNVYQALCESLNVPKPSPTWWINFRVIDEGSWGSRGGVISIHTLLESGVFTPERVRSIQESIERLS